MTVLKPNSFESSTFLQDIEGTGGGVASRLNALKVSSKNKNRELFITVIDSYASGKSEKVKASVVTTGSDEVLVLETDKEVRRFKLMTERADKITPLLIENR